RTVALAGTSATAVTFDAGNNIVAAALGTGDFAAIRLLPNGALDPSFSSDGMAFVDFGGNDQALAVAMHNGKILLGGGGFVNRPGLRDPAFAQLDSAGNLDPTFNGTGKNTLSPAATFGSLDSQITALKVLPAGGGILGAGNYNKDFLLLKLTDT